MDLLGKFYQHSSIISNQYSDFSTTVKPNSFLFPIQKKLTTNNHLELPFFTSNVINSLPIKYDLNLFNNSIVDISNNKSNCLTKALKNQKKMLPNLSSNSLFNNNTVLMKESIEQVPDPSQVSYNTFLLQEKQQEFVASQNCNTNFLSFLDKTHEVVQQKSICNTGTNNSTTDVKLSKISMPFFQATTMRHSTISKPNENNSNLSLPLNFSAATTMIQTISSVSSINSVVGNLDRFSPSSISCASIDSGFSESSYQSESPGSSLPAILNPIIPLLTCKKKNNLLLSKSEPVLSELTQKEDKKCTPKRLFMSIESMINENNSNCSTNNDNICLNDKNNNTEPPTKIAKILSNNIVINKVFETSSIKDLKSNTDFSIKFAESIIKPKIECADDTSKTKSLLGCTNQTEKKYSSEASTSSEKLFDIKKDCTNSLKNTDNKIIKTEIIESEKLFENVERFLECGCFWTNCESRFATDNELYDHVIQAIFFKIYIFFKIIFKLFLESY